ncbi:MAG: dTDP-4-dehydrorhamnose 3,5-epimerase [Archangium sp.]
MNVDTTSLPGVLLVSPRVFGDARGFFLETFSAQKYAEQGITGPFVQDNWSRSAKNILRGLHFQHPQGQGKLVSCTRGAVFDVAVDVRLGSPSFGKWYGVELSGENKKQLWIPPGFAHGFCVLSDVADFLYKCTELYAPKYEQSVLWNDPEIGIDWPVKEPLLSAKDAAARRLSAMHDALPTWTPA